MTDAGKFERLAVMVLRQTVPDCSELQHVGVNAQEKTIPAPVDAFHFVPGSEPQHIIFACFTTSSELKRKWLGGMNEDGTFNNPLNEGDLVKAVRKANRLRQTHPRAVFTIFLCTNRRASVDLNAEVLAYAAKHSVNVRFLTQSQIRDHLDSDQEGNHLRQLFFGINAKRVSVELLKDFSRISLRKYQNLLLTDFRKPTVSQENFSKKFHGRRGLTFFVASSGVGKSVQCLTIMKNHVEKGGIAIWIPEYNFPSNHNITTAIQKTIEEQYPTLSPDSGKEVLRLSEQEDILLIIDDLSRADRPDRMAERIVEWSSDEFDSTALQCFPNKESSQINTGSRKNLHILVPMHEPLSTKIFDQRNGSNQRSHTEVIRLGEWDSEETRLFLHRELPGDKRLLTPSDVDFAIDQCAGLPIMVSMLIDLASRERFTSLSTLAENVLKSYINRKITDASSLQFTSAELWDSLRALCKVMLEQRTTRVSTMSPYLNEGQRRSLSLLGEKNTLVRVTGETHDQRYEFKHDQIFEEFAVAEFESEWKKVTPNRDLLEDPYFASISARALFTGDLDNPQDLVSEQGMQVLAESLRFAERDVKTMQSICQRLNAWFGQDSLKGSCLELDQWLAVRRLATIWSPFVLQATECRKFDRGFRLARFANGDFDAGICELGHQEGFPLFVRFEALERAIFQAVATYRTDFTATCCRVLSSSSSTSNDLHGALVLAGFLGDPLLTQHISSAWKSIQDKSQFVDLAIWACLRCSGPELKASLSPILDFWAGLPDDVEDSNIVYWPRTQIGQNLASGFRFGIDEFSVCLLIEAAEAHEGLTEAIATSLRDVCCPSALDFIVQYKAQVDHKLNIFLFKRPRNESYPIATSSIVSFCEHMLTIAENDSAEKAISDAARVLWAEETHDTSKLQLITDSDVAYRSALLRRIELGDKSALKECKIVFGDRPHYWGLVAKLADSEVFAQCEAELDKLAALHESDPSKVWSDLHYSLAKFLRDVDPVKAQEILVRRWDQLKASPLFIQLALYLSEPQTVELAVKEVERSIEPDMAFKYLWAFFGFFDQELHDRLRRKHFDALERVLQFIPDKDFADMAKAARKIGFGEWNRRVLRKEVDRRIKEFGEELPSDSNLLRVRMAIPTSKDLVDSFLKTFAMSTEPAIKLHIWTERYIRYTDSHCLVSDLARLALLEDPTSRTFELVSEVVGSVGSRSDITVLEKWLETCPFADSCLDPLKKARLAVRSKALA